MRAGGELPFLSELPKLATDLLPSPESFPENLAQSWTADRSYAATMFRDFYLARAAHHGLSEGALFTDRMPFNEVYLPLLKMAFPQAKIVHVVRHPLDVSVSMLANTMPHGLNCGYRIEDITHHLAAVFDLFDHYRNEMELGEYVLRYESLVCDPAEETRKLLDYVGLPLEETPALSRTQPASGKLDDRSIDRHEHYARSPDPYASRLSRIMGAYGYS